MARVVSSGLLSAFFFASGEFSARDYEPASATVAIAGSPVHRARAADVVDERLPRAMRSRKRRSYHWQAAPASLFVDGYRRRVMLDSRV